jgi:transglutaminase-like putative cysteine protease
MCFNAVNGAALPPRVINRKNGSKMAAPLSQDQLQLGDLIRRVAAERVLPQAAEIDRTTEYPQDMFDLLRELGLFTLPFPAEFGGSGNVVPACLAIEEFGRVCYNSAYLPLRPETRMTVLTVHHTTVYRYAVPVAFGEHRLMFRPRESYDQKLLDETLTIVPEPADIRWIHDVFGNCVAIVNFDARAAELSFESNVRLEHTPSNLPDLRIDPGAVVYPFAYSDEEMPDLVPFIARRYPDPADEVGRWVRRFLRAGRTNETGALLMTLTAAIQQSFVYLRRAEPGTHDPALTLKLGYGSCRDLALLMMEAVRSLGLAARFASGYLYVPSRDAAAVVGGGSMHAWCQVYLPGAGWAEFDPTNGIVGSRDLIRVAVARDPRQAMPLSGSWFGRPESCLGMTVEVKVRRADDAGN